MIQRQTIGPGINPGIADGFQNGCQLNAQVFGYLGNDFAFAHIVKKARKQIAALQFVKFAMIAAQDINRLPQVGFLSGQVIVKDREIVGMRNNAQLGH